MTLVEALNDMRAVSVDAPFARAQSCQGLSSLLELSHVSSGAFKLWVSWRAKVLVKRAVETRGSWRDTEVTRVLSVAGRTATKGGQ